MLVIVKPWKDCSLAPLDASQLVARVEGGEGSWDVETGKVLHTMTAERQMMNCVRFYPKDYAASSWLAHDATSGAVFQWDLREKGEPTLIYNHHLAPCNSITFIDDGKSFALAGGRQKDLCLGRIAYPPASTSSSRTALRAHRPEASDAAVLVRPSMDNSIGVYG